MTKLISWNVNGIRAAVNTHDFIATFNQLDADVFCIQETKVQEGQIELELPGYHQYWNFAERKGYSGTAIFTKEEPLSVSTDIGNEELDHEGRVITAEYANYYVVCCYTPNAQPKLKRLAFRQQWDAVFLDYLQKLNAVKPVVVCGDLNVAHEPIDLKNPTSNHHNPGFSDEERADFSNWLAAGYVDSFRMLHPNEAGIYSWWSYRFHARENNSGWRIDYFVVSEILADQIAAAEILTDIYGSDHCPVELDFAN
ncbi:exodeoxyribonuclease III [Lentilactobacillus senioris]|uniref:exodeoxyribonuclease III n=1 Tax=Lentilactobacillus senioris TaxID=931534 RepID=UPI002282A08F|nr:exodeoxyribonuclease III [Lentilactobacillus senioris]MCY9805962.1 exodeoxyribonuclease III [Lentilactobacillus senioris]